MICKKCGAELVYKRHTSEIVWECPKCGWAVATTYIDPIHEDDTIYSIVLHCNDNVTKEKLKIVSKVAACNFVEAKALMSRDGALLMKEKAVRIKESASLLKECGVEFEIIPKFEYAY